MNRPQFAAFLHRLADSVASGDSAEGCVVYALSDRGPDEIDLDIRVRTGNLEGQGGYHIVDTMPKQDGPDMVQLHVTRSEFGHIVGAMYRDALAGPASAEAETRALHDKLKAMGGTEETE